MAKRKAKGQQPPARARHQRRLLLAAALVVLGLCALAVNRQALRAWYLARVPLEQLVARAARAGEDRELRELAAARLLAAARPAEARTVLEARVETLGDRPLYRTLLGRACLETGSLNEAYAHLKVALMLRPEDADAHWWLAETLRRADRESEAVPHYRRVTELAPRRGEPWLRLGAYSIRTTQYTTALEYLDEGEKRMPTSEVARFRGLALWKLGRMEEAVAAARTSVARQSTAASELLLGQLLAASADPARWREAAAHLERAVAQEPENDDAHRELGLLYRQRGEHRRAVRHLRAHLRRNPGAARSYPPLAQSYQALGQRELAAAVLRIYRRLEPIEMKTAQAEYQVVARKEAPEARLELARVYVACGFEDRAREVLAKLLQDHPGYPPAARLLARVPDRRSLVIPPLPPDPEADA